MREQITRRDFLMVVVNRSRTPARIALWLLTAVAVAWVVVVAFEMVRAVTIDGWFLIGCIAVVAALLSAVRWGASRVYARMPLGGKAICDTVGESLFIITVMGVGMLLWHKFQSGDTPAAIPLVVVLCVLIVRRGGEAYRRRIREQGAR